MKLPFLLFKRGRYWDYRHAEEVTFHTTGQTTRVKAEAFVVELLRSHEGHSRQRHASFRQYADPFFIRYRCLHIRRLREEGKSITRRHAKIQRQRLENHILTDPFASKRVSEITRADVLDLRSRLLQKNAPATVNKALGIVKVIFREALYREEINRDPTAGVGNVRYQKEEHGIFTVEELRMLFPDHGNGPWKDVRDSTCFYLAAVTGLRRGEILALRWQHIDFDRKFLKVCEAWKGGSEIGLPKWDHMRLVPNSSRTINKLTQLKAESIRISLEDFVVCYDDGSRIGET